MKEVTALINKTLDELKKKEPERYDRSFQVNLTIRKLVVDDYKKVFGIAGITSKGYTCYVTNSEGKLKFHCDCEDFKKRGKFCKHLLRLLVVLQTFVTYRIEPNSRTRIEEIEERLRNLESKYYKLVEAIHEVKV